MASARHHVREIAPLVHGQQFNAEDLRKQAYRIMFLPSIAVQKIAPLRAVILSEAQRSRKPALREVEGDPRLLFGSQARIAGHSAFECYISSMDSRLLVGLAVLFLAIDLSAQQAGPNQKLDPVQSAQRVIQSMDMQKWLNSNDSQQRIERLVNLGVERTEAEELTRSSHQAPKWFPIRTERTAQSAILFLPCIRDNAYIYLLVQENGSWLIKDKEAPDCHYDESVSVEIAPVGNSASDEILVHHVGAGHGAGISVQNFNVLGVSNERFKNELDVEEVVNASRPHLGSNDRDDLIQRSFFVLVPINHSKSRLIEETRSSELNDKLTVRRRLFRWNPDKGRYTPSKFVPVEAAAAN